MNNIKDYIVVKNILSKELCSDIITKIDKKENWIKHNWYDSKENKTYSQATKELDIVSSDNQLSEVLNPLINNAYKDYVKQFSNNGENTSNFINYFTPVRFNRYNTGTKMRKHYDFIQSIFDGQSKFSTPYKGVPILSLVGVLNNDYEGGEFVFNDNHIVTLSTGDVLIFPSTFMYAHEVKEITNGKRYSFVSWGF